VNRSVSANGGGDTNFLVSKAGSDIYLYGRWGIGLGQEMNVKKD
jgi:hypothetical protein